MGIRKPTPAIRHFETNKTPVDSSANPVPVLTRSVRARRVGRGGVESERWLQAGGGQECPLSENQAKDKNPDRRFEAKFWSNPCKQL